MSNLITNGIIKNKIEPQIQRALIFQGGGALGAYEAGVYKALYDNLYKSALEEKKPVFDIISGTSAGAINATLIVDHVLENNDKTNPWAGSAEKLCQFWKEISTDTWLFENPFLTGLLDASYSFRECFNTFWGKVLKIFDEYTDNIRYKSHFLSAYYLWPDRLGSLASKESFRRYWSWLQFSYSPLGTHNVLSPAIYQPDFKFLNPYNHMFRYDNTPLTDTIRRYWDYDNHPIKTEEGQPRLLLVAIDVQDATTVTFDSYSKKGKQMVSVYGDEDTKLKHVIRYPNGIGIEHLLTTMSSHLRFKFPELYALTTEIKNDEEIPEGKGHPRIFMDGFYLSNTPLREVLQSHRDYWYKVKGSNGTVPPLNIYIGDLYPTSERGTPEDPDSINNRIQNVLFHDKSKYDEKSANMISDYVNVINSLMRMLMDKEVSEDKIYENLKKDVEEKMVSNDRKGKQRIIEDLVKGRFTIDKVQRIGYGEGQSLNDSEDIFGKAFDFSSHTINELITQGYKDTCVKCNFKP